MYIYIRILYICNVSMYLCVCVHASRSPSFCLSDVVALELKLSFGLRQAGRNEEPLERVLQ